MNAPARVLIACEFSGIVRDAFIRRGISAMSADLLPTERPGPHYRGDVRDILHLGFELMVAHPPCTYLANSGVRHLSSVPSKNGRLPAIHGAERFALMEEAAEFFKTLLNAPIPRVAVENPIMHWEGWIRVGRTYDQKVQPYWFGDGEQKATCLWLRNLPLLVPTNVVGERYQRAHMVPPGKDRWKERSRTPHGMARAMAIQWGGIL